MATASAVLSTNNPVVLNCTNYLKPQSDRITISISESEASVQFVSNNTDLIFQKSTQQIYPSKSYFTAFEGQLELLIPLKILSGDLLTASVYIIQDQSKMEDYKCHLQRNEFF